MRASLARYIALAIAGVEHIPEARKALLERLGVYLSKRLVAGEPVHLTFICTHNSRRSQMAQLWAAAAAAHFGVEGVRTFSGGTEVTAFDPRAVAAMARAGFAVEDPGGENPHYAMAFADEGPALECFSKRYDDPFNPQDGFAAIMTCSDADEACPVVPGAELRVPVPFEDPKVADDRPDEVAVYDARCQQIATEMLYLFSRVA